MSMVSIAPELERLGLTPFFRQQLLGRDTELDAERPSVAGRIACERRGEYEVLDGERSFRATLSGRLAHELSGDERPAVGDWVLVEPADPVGRLHDVLERQSVLRRLEVDGTSRSQTLAANVDVVFVVGALSPDDAGRHVARRTLNPRRIERFLAVAHAARVAALVVVNKADVANEPERALAELAAELSGIELLLASAESGYGLDALRERIPPGSTAVLLGSSGVGKSSLMNRLLGRSALRTGSVRDDDARGRHTTTERQLLVLPNGGLLVDTPGMRELGLFAEAGDDDGAIGFADIDELAGRCRFGDCRHDGEPGCAVRAALVEGSLPLARFESFRKLERERRYQLSRTDARLRHEANQRNRAISRAARARVKAKRGE